MTILADPSLAGCDSAAASRELRRPPLVIVVEGRHDATFLLRLATLWRERDPRLPDLERLAASGEITLLPIGGGGAADILRWNRVLAGFGRRRFHLHDREAPPETAQRAAAIARLNDEPNCVAQLSAKRALENYLHPAAILAAGGPLVRFGDDEDVATLVARARLAAIAPQVAWDALDYRRRRRLATRAKRWLFGTALAHLTCALAAERDPAREVVGWLRAIDELRRW